MLVELSKSVALLLMLSVIEEHIARKWSNRENFKQLFSGILFGCICVIGMSSPIHMGDGVILDPRSVIMSISGLFGGLLVGAIAAAIASIYRLWIGGNGASVGIAVIIASVLIGLVYRKFVQHGILKINIPNLLMFGLVVNFIQIYLFTYLPGEVEAVIMKDVAMPLFGIFTVATVLLGIMMQSMNSNIETEVILAESEKRFRDFAEITSDYFWEMDADLRFSYFSEHFRKITNVNPADLLGKTRNEAPLPGVDLAAWTQHLNDLEEHRAFRDFIISRPAKDGSVIWLSLAGRPVLDDEGNFCGYRGTGTNITELVAARLTQERLSQAIENVPIGIVLFDKDDRLVFSNTRHKELLSAIRDIITPGVTFETLIRALVDRQSVMGSVGREEEFIQERINEHKNPSGPLDIRCNNMWLNENEILLADGSIFTIITDITDRVKAEQALAESNASLQAVLDYTPICINLKDVEGRYLLVNKPYEEWFGHSADEIIGKKASDLIENANEINDLNAAERRVLETGVAFESEINVQRPDGKVYDRILIKYPVKTKEGVITGLGTVAIDITERKRSEKALQAAKTAAERANKAKSNFLANMNHELRTPLNAILGFSQMLMEGTFGSVGSDKNKEYIQYIYTSGQHLYQLVGRILDISKIEAGKAVLDQKNVDVRAVVNECIGLMSDGADRKRVKIKSNMNINAPLLYADRMMLVEMVLNILSNAIKFTPEGGAVNISVSNNERHSIVIEIKDTGIGISHDDLDFVFEPFGQVRDALTNPYEGTGLGLTLVKAQMNMHGGTVEVSSELACGTTVILTFPPERTIAGQACWPKAKTPIKAGEIGTNHYI